MCDHCGCREIGPIGRLMDEHERLLEVAGEAREAARAGDEATAGRIIAELAVLLRPHVQAEEDGLFAVMRERGEYTDYLDQLEDEHAELADRLAGRLTPLTVLEIRARLQEHIQHEEYGLFPAALASLGGDDWTSVTDREDRPGTGVAPRAVEGHLRGRRASA